MSNLKLIAMNQKSDKAKLAFFSESVMERMKIEINRVSQFYKSDRITLIQTREMLQLARKDLRIVHRMIRKERKKVDFLRKVKKSMDQKIQEGEYCPDTEEVSFEDMKIKKIGK